MHTGNTHAHTYGNKLAHADTFIDGKTERQMDGQSDRYTMSMRQADTDTDLVGTYKRT